MELFCQQICNTLKEKYKDNFVLLSCLKSLHLQKKGLKPPFSYVGEVPSHLHKEKLTPYLPFLEKELSIENKCPLSKIHLIVNKANFPTSLHTKNIEKNPFPLPFTNPSQPLNAHVSTTCFSFNPQYTFKNFITGPFNSLAYASAYHLANKPLSSLYNPLFIYSPSGLGKTHLLHAIGQKILKKKKDVKIIYTSAEQFLDEYVSSINQKNMKSFRKKYRKDCQILLIDDIQAIENGKASQDEFFHTFNAITDKGGLVVCTCDRIPKEIKKLQTRNQTRLAGGLQIHIDSPDIQTCKVILEKKTLERKRPLSSEVISYLSDLPYTSIRELIGHLNQVHMHCEIKEQENSKNLSSAVKISPSLNFIRSIFEKNNVDLYEYNFQTPQDILKKISKTQSIPLTDLICFKKRSQQIVKARTLAIHLIKKNFKNLSLSEISQIFGTKNTKAISRALKR